MALIFLAFFIRKLFVDGNCYCNLLRNVYLIQEKQASSLNYWKAKIRYAKRKGGCMKALVKTEPGYNKWNY